MHACFFDTACDTASISRVYLDQNALTSSLASSLITQAGQPVTDDVDLKSARALSVAYKGLGVSPSDIGKYATKQPELGCL